LKPAGPERESVTFTETFIGTNLLFGGQRIFGPALHVTVGGVLSIWTVIVLAVSTLPALSAPKKVIIVTPSALTTKVADPPLTMVSPMVCAPVVLYVTCFTPELPGSLSVEFSMTVTFVLFHPFALGAGDTEAVVTGGIVSEVTVGALIAIGFPLEGERVRSVPNDSTAAPADLRSIPAKKSAAGDRDGIGLPELSRI
jgi:hypothetical protein